MATPTGPKEDDLFVPQLYTFLYKTKKAGKHLSSHSKKVVKRDDRPT